MRGERSRVQDEYCLVLTPTSTAALRASEATWRHFESLDDEPRRNLATVIRSLVEHSVDQGPEKAITVNVSVSADSIRGEVLGNVTPAAKVSLLRGRAGRNGNGHHTNGNAGVLGLLEGTCSRWAVYQGTTDVWFEIPLIRSA
jgi:hypothetical protein